MANAHDLLMAQRAAMMGGKTLPYDAEVEYLESSNGGYIDTGTKFSTDMKIESSYICLGTGSGGGLNVYGIPYGAFNESDSNTAQLSCLIKSRYAGGNWYGDKSFLNSAGGLNQRILETRDFNGCTIETELSTKAFNYNATQGYESKITILIFALRLTNVAITANTRMFYFRISKNGNYVIDLTPVRFTNENGVSEGAMYDRVSGQLFRNAGTGAFIIGPDKT